MDSDTKTTLHSRRSVPESTAANSLPYPEPEPGIGSSTPNNRNKKNSPNPDEPRPALTQRGGRPRKGPTRRACNFTIGVPVGRYPRARPFKPNRRRREGFQLGRYSSSPMQRDKAAAK